MTFFLFQDRNKLMAVESPADGEDEEIPKISLQEMMDDLNLSDEEMTEADWKKILPLSPVIFDWRFI